jgi:hypothetical protein
LATSFSDKYGELIRRVKNTLEIQVRHLFDVLRIRALQLLVICCHYLEQYIEGTLWLMQPGTTPLEVM